MAKGLPGSTLKTGAAGGAGGADSGWGGAVKRGAAPKGLGEVGGDSAGRLKGLAAVGRGSGAAAKGLRGSTLGLGSAGATVKGLARV